MKPVYPSLPSNPANGWYNTSLGKPVSFIFDHSITKKNVSFNPWNEKSKSGVTEYSWMSWPVNQFYHASDNDFASLEKLMYSNPFLVNYVLNRGMAGKTSDDNG